MDDSTGPILVGYDGSTDADLALDWAAESALLLDESMDVAIVDDPGALPGVAWWPDDHWVEVEQRAARRLKAAGVDRSSIHLRRGAVVPTLVDMALQASLLVLGSRGHGRAGEIFIGSVSQHLARHAGCPVVVVRPVASREAKRIVVGVDGSSSSNAALAFACRRARATGETVTAVRAAAFGPVQLDRRGLLPEKLGTFLTEQERQLAETMGELVGAHPDVDVDSEFIALSPAQALVDASRHASLVVVGSRGLNPFAGLLLGSVSHDVLHRAHCPVAVVR